jgi:hypothetical protein
LAPPTPATSGQNGSVSSASAALQSSLASRLRARLARTGSTECILTWKDKVTPLGRRYCQLALSARRTGGTASGLWPTPVVTDGANTRNATAVRHNLNSKHHSGTTLLDAAEIALWPTPTAVDRVRDDETMAKCAAFRKRNAGQNTVPFYLGEVARNTALWATPTARDHKDGVFTPNVETNALLGRQVWNGSSEQTEKLGWLNQAFVCWLMGYREDWGRAAPNFSDSQNWQAFMASLSPEQRATAWDRFGVTATPLSRRSRLSSSAPISTELV